MIWINARVAASADDRLHSFIDTQPGPPAMIDSTVVELSRLQFAVTAMYHFIFPPLTMGLSFLLGI
ncbi:hypothetical protein AN651_10655, partial [Xanthomonas arboricola]